MHLFAAVPQTVGHKRKNGSTQQVRIRLHLLITLRRNHPNFRMPFQLLAQFLHKGRNAALFPLHAFRRTGEQFQMADTAQHAIRLPPNFRRNIRLLQPVQTIRLNEQIGCAVAQIRRRQGDARCAALRFCKYQHRPAFHRYDVHVPLSAIEQHQLLLFCVLRHALPNELAGLVGKKALDTVERALGKQPAARFGLSQYHQRL